MEFAAIARWAKSQGLMTPQRKVGFQGVVHVLVAAAKGRQHSPREKR
jgi:hypothetical protein